MMSFGAGRIHCALALFAMISSTGCGTIVTFTGVGGPPDPLFEPRIYGGVRLDGQGLGVGASSYHGFDLGWVKIILLVDLPISLAMDTVTLPITIPIELTRHSETPEETAEREAREKAEREREKQEQDRRFAEDVVYDIVLEVNRGSLNRGSARYLQMMGKRAINALQSEIDRLPDSDLKSKLMILLEAIKKPEPLPSNYQP
ncbi:MAG TPA: YceK/YidQ family lipoprotein [Planctomycetota bacterium]|jgi:uncharacterized protein YceK|nr:YceK/YidQ family lipoprotein [Planctomycetota bacterium]